MKKMIATVILAIGMFNSGSALADVTWEPIPQTYGECVNRCFLGGKGWIGGPFGAAYCAVYCSL
ncbi:hypothetical protein OIV19_19005 [Brucella sp. HL-2]|nr:hypothetical protein [Brucella sp. HL-2]MCV9909693.1 hypothetical protein [Brucella sp. HL-2]